MKRHSSRGEALVSARLLGAITFIFATVLSASAFAAISTSNSAAGVQVTAHPGAITFHDFDGAANPLVGIAVGGTLCPGGGACGTDPGTAGNYGSISSGGDTITVTLTGLKDYFGFFWGTPDTYNSVSFFRDLTPLGSFSGTIVDGGLAGAGRFLNFSAPSSADYFNRVVIESAGCCFEVDNFASMATAPIPEPSTYALMLAGLGIVGIMARRRRRDA